VGEGVGAEDALSAIADRTDAAAVVAIDAVGDDPHEPLDGAHLIAVVGAQGLLEFSPRGEDRLDGRVAPVGLLQLGQTQRVERRLARISKGLQREPLGGVHADDEQPEVDVVGHRMVAGLAGSDDFVALGLFEAGLASGSREELRRGLGITGADRGVGRGLVAPEAVHADEEHIVE